MTGENYCSKKVESLNGFTVGDLVYCADMNALTPAGRPKDDRPGAPIDHLELGPRSADCGNHVSRMLTAEHFSRKTLAH